MTRKVFAAGDVIAAADINANFDDVAAGQVGITADDLASNAGLTSTQLTDRFAIITETVQLTGYYHRENVAGTLAVYYLPNVQASPGTEVWRKNMMLRTGRAFYLVGVTIYAQDVSYSSTNYPNVWVTRNGTVLGGSFSRIVAADTKYTLANSNPFDNPLTALADNDYLTIGLGVEASATTTSVAGLTVTLTYKMELIP